MQQIILLFFMFGLVLSNGLNGKRPNFETYTKHKKHNGFDHRPKNDSKHTMNNDELLKNIRGFFEKKLTIDVLRNPNIPIFEKMRIIDELTSMNSPKLENLFAGGLMSNWDFDMDH
jgi:hypothetical protein